MTISRTNRVLPGVFFSMLLASSVLASPAHAASADQQQTPPPRKSLSQDHRRPSAGARAQKSTKSATTKVAGAGSTARRRVQTTVTPVAFIDDGFSYTEDSDGHVAWKQTGIASWYGGRRWQGNLTASGVRYDENALTAAHATLPLGSHIRVTLANSERSVIVTITDRPGTRTRIIDLSRGAAAALGILSQGVAVVTLTPS